MGQTEQLNIGGQFAELELTISGMEQKRLPDILHSGVNNFIASGQLTSRVTLGQVI